MLYMRSEKPIIMRSHPVSEEFSPSLPLKQFPSKHAGSDPEAFWLRIVMAVTASVHPESAPDRICLIWLLASDSVPFFCCCFFQKRPEPYCAKSTPDPIWMAWSWFGQTHLVWKQAVVQESQGRFLAGRNRPATSFPLSDPVAIIHRRPESYCATRIRFSSGWLVSGFGQKGPVRNQTGVQESSGPLLANASQPIRHVYWGPVFVGLTMARPASPPSVKEDRRVLNSSSHAYVLQVVLTENSLATFCNKAANHLTGMQRLCP